MLFSLILILALIFFIILFAQTKKQLEKAKQQINALENSATEKPTEEFTLGLTKLNSEFAGNIALDLLTGLPGREAFEDRLLQTVNQSKRFEKSFAILLLDIHEFKLVNETHEHDIGDKLLIEISKRLQSVIRQIDTMTRYAGNTFVFLLPQLASPETAAYVAQRLLDSIVQPFNINEIQLFITASIGVAIYPKDGADAATILKNADDALRQSKLTGTGRYQFYGQEMHAMGQRELGINNVLCGPDLLQHLVIHYQPYINVSTNEIVCIQAVPFLNVTDFGLIPFLEFSKLAENCGRIVAIGEYVLKEAIQQFNKWREDKFKAEFLTMNVTLRQIENPQFIFKISHIIQEFKMDPQKIIFEISDENIFSNARSIEKSFSMLSKLNVKIAISVFALGHLALQRLTNLPINYLKIEGKIIHGDKPNQDSEMILHMMVTLAKDMKISILADGITNETQKNLLQSLGCELMQGPLFGEPLPVESVVKNF